MRLLIIILFFISSTCLYGQFSMEEFLGATPKGVEIQTVQAIRDYVSKTKFKSPLLREVEVRLRTRLENPDQNDYRLRFSPINPFEKRANLNYRNAIQRQMDTEYTVQLNEALLNQYELLIAHYTYSSTAEQLLKSEQFYKKVIDLTRQQPQRFDLQDVIEFDKKLLEIQLELHDARLDLQRLEYLIKLTYPYSGAIEWNTNELVSTTQIEQWLQNRTLDIDNSLMVQNAIEESLVEESIFEVNKHESFSNLGFVQAEYQRDQDNPFRDNLGFQVGLSLPIVNSDKPDLERRKIDLVETEQKIKEERFSVQNDMVLYDMEIRHLIEKHKLLTEKLSDYKTTPQSVLNSSKSLIVAQEIEEFKMDLQLMKIATYSDLLQGYIALLAVEGTLVADPLLNYLSHTKTPFELQY